MFNFKNKGLLKVIDMAKKCKGFVKMQGLTMK